MPRTTAIPTAQVPRPLEINSVLPWLAPLAGYSDLPFRTLCREYGAAVCETEMVSAKGLIYSSPGTNDLLISHCADEPLVVQLFGGEAESMAEAVVRLRRYGYTRFDCNMGCPVRKVLRQGAGAALMAAVPLATQIGRAMLEACRARGEDLPGQPAKIGFKLRLGPDGFQNTLSLARYLEDAGAAWITFHPRTAAQGFGGVAHWEYTGRLVEALDIPVIASGDLFTAEAGVACLRETGAAAVMYARGALKDPLIFARHRAVQTGEARSLPMVAEVVRRHVALARKYGATRSAFMKMRSIIPRYAKHLPGINEFRLRLCQCEDWDALLPVVNEFFPDGVDHESS